MFAYGFEDLTGAEWALIQALAGRAEVTVSIPYEPGRAVFIDDVEANAAAARPFGFHAIRFSTPPALREELGALGLLAARNPRSSL